MPLNTELLNYNKVKIVRSYSRVIVIMKVLKNTRYIVYMTAVHSEHDTRYIAYMTRGT